MLPLFMNTLIFIGALLVLALFGGLGISEIIRAVRHREIGIQNPESFPYSFGPYKLDESPIRFSLSVVVNLFFFVFGFGGIFLILLFF
ncbi:hypothetical protein RB2150_11441 [Rhodobacteraceae bacterium HTCC2150]|nr:hypothetical protein RB2150_11441 [Rhodobacteraceae bacterium HTCC2150]